MTRSKPKMIRSKPRKNRSLARVADPQGRVDVLLYQLVNRGMERIERERGVIGLCENILPIVERFIVQHVPERNLFPEDLAAIFRICEMNRRQER